MALFPGAQPVFAGFTAGHTLAQDSHAAQHNLEQAEIVAVATKIGTGASTPAAGLILRGNGAGSSVWGQAVLTTDVTGILPVANGGTGQASLTALPLVSPSITGTVPGGATYTTPVLTTPTIADFTNAQHDHSDADDGGQLGTNALVADAVTQGSTTIEMSAPTQDIAASAFTDITGATGSFTSQDGGDLLVIATFGGYKKTGTGPANYRVLIGSTEIPNSVGWVFYWNTLLEHQSNTFVKLATGIAAGTYTVKMQAKCDSNHVSCDNNDYLGVTILELKR